MSPVAVFVWTLAGCASLLAIAVTVGLIAHIFAEVRSHFK